MPHPDSGSIVANGFSPEAASQRNFWGLALGCIGVVYGDIGTSPLYAMRESVHAATGGGQTPLEPVILGILSLIVWALILIVTVKYVLILLLADNAGEGGTPALMALANRAVGGKSFPIILLGIISAALFYGDALITPAISVLSAVEGLKIATPALEDYVVPLTVLILFGLFAVQSHGTARVATFFGPITLVWFIALALGGIAHIAQNPGVLAALNPAHGVMFLGSHDWIGLATLGAVFLALTGCEALYADLGHFGRGPIQTAWLLVALPALTSQLFRSGGIAARKPGGDREPLLSALPGLGAPPHAWACLGGHRHRQPGGDHRRLLAHQPGRAARATAAAAHPAHLGDASGPDLHPAHQRHPARRRAPARRSAQVLERARFGLRHRRERHHGGDGAIGARGDLEVLEVAALGRGDADRSLPAHRYHLPHRQMLKVFHGGWVPLLIGGFVILIMLTWRRGAKIFATKTRWLETPIEVLIKSLEKSPPPRLPGTAVFLTATPDSAPDRALTQSQAL
jgi:KUP system potassium uptake protein